jgi:hypothetical protein
MRTQIDHRMKSSWKPRVVFNRYTVEKLGNEKLSNTGVMRTSPYPLLKHHPGRPKLGDSIPPGEKKEGAGHAKANGLVALTSHCFPQSPTVMPHITVQSHMIAATTQ